MKIKMAGKFLNSGLNRSTEEKKVWTNVTCKDVDKYYDQAEAEDIKTLFIKANAIRRSVIEKEKTIADLDNALENIEKKNKALQ